MDQKQLLESFFKMDFENKQNKLILSDPSTVDKQSVIAYIKYS